MKYLVYGILRRADGESAPLPTGLEGDAIALIAEGDLGAAVSVVPESYAIPGVPRLLAYAQVVEALSRLGPVLPMSYGCLLESTAQVMELLRRRFRMFQATLAEVDGCVEMALRVLLDEGVQPAVPRVGTEQPQAETMACRASEQVPACGLQPVERLPKGTAYLAGRKARYASNDRIGAQGREGIARWREPFAGLFVKCLGERVATQGARLLSLHFLLRSANVEEFHEVFHRLQTGCSDKLLLSGPWPPYHFVSSLTVDRFS